MRLAIILCAALCGCATAPAPRIVTKEVRIPEPVRCVDPAKIPSEPREITLSLDARTAADQASAQARDLRGWGRKLYALIVPACTRE